MRRRGAELENTLLTAAWEEYLAVGYAKLTMEGVAARARTGKQVLYRRWPNRVQLMAAVVRRRLGPLVGQPPNTGSLRGDVLAILHLMVDRFRKSPADLLFGMASEFPNLKPEFFQATNEVMMDILRKAVERGELAHANVNPRVATLPTDLLRYEGWKASGTAGREFVQQAGQQAEQQAEQQAALETVAERLILEIVDDVYLPLIHAVAGHRPE